MFIPRKKLNYNIGEAREGNLLHRFINNNMLNLREGVTSFHT